MYEGISSVLMDQLVEMYFDYISNPDTAHTQENLVTHASTLLCLECFCWEDLRWHINEYLGY